jgi:hypothetical protein
MHSRVVRNAMLPLNTSQTSMYSNVSVRSKDKAWGPNPAQCFSEQEKGSWFVSFYVIWINRRLVG